ncbi:MAG: hypothetical protein H6621_12080 [Halobacteriovoraceae bacterium]|nr:hypothetical protein [Halobacteriovoraceae bacterium]MCB9095800.1 hypothetical protein [Halobacteriovoraceae bacterium]
MPCGYILQAGIGYGMEAGWYLKGGPNGSLELVIVPPGSSDGLTFSSPIYNEHQMIFPLGTKITMICSL